MRVIIAIQARLGSSRLPNKAMVDIWGVPLISRMIQRLREVKGADGVIVACPIKDAPAFKKLGLRVISGPEQDVLTRIMNVVEETEATKIVKVGADCPFVPFDLIDLAIQVSKDKGIVQNTVPRTYPDGFDFEVWDAVMLSSLDKVLGGDQREWFTSWALEHCESVPIKAGGDFSRFRLTVDYPEDLEVARALYTDMGKEQWGFSRILEWCIQNPEIMKKNAHRVTDFGARPK